MASRTNRARPRTRLPPGDAVTTTSVLLGAVGNSGCSGNATVRIIVPPAIEPSNSVPRAVGASAWRMCGARTPLSKTGPATGPRPSSSKSTAVSVSDAPTPPSSSEIAMLSHPRSAILAHAVASKPTSACDSATSRSIVISVRTKRRTDSWRSCCSVVSERSIRRSRSGQAAGLFGLHPTDTHAARHDQLLNLTGAATVHACDGAGVRAHHAVAVGAVLVDERVGPEHVEDRLGEPLRRLLLHVVRLRALVAARLVGHRQPVV